ncbi:MAG: bifunctional ornithine acetyltransferase/N-acetylglutamate synthase, partial [Alkaliphilus sp.]|nr:bifunctional ornithine acetyltransferase/N-acetylglutamate synthase [Alkaliphilus sp.]
NVKISKALLAKALTDSVEQTYNMISVDGDTSTNDMVIMLANGTADNPILDQEDENFTLFKSALDYVNKELAKLIAKDGEGATKLIEATVLHAQSLQDARLCAKAVISSSLVKSAFFGSDANWGRILCAMGYSKGVFDPAKVSIAFANTKGFVDLVKNGIAVAFSEEKAKEILLEDYINIIIDLKDGENNATAWGCDLSYDYVKINGSYRN